MRVIISGLTAAGKTTHARLLAEELGCPCFSMGQLLARLHSSGLDQWVPEVDDRRAEDKSLDQRLDALALETLSDNEDCVMDAWALPWFSQGIDAVRVWIGSDLHSRVLKAKVAELREGRTSGYCDRRAVVTRKDQFSRQRFSELHQFDLYTDRTPFDIVVDNSCFMRSASIAASDAGVENFRPVLRSAVLECAR
jgi:cytidylate kinase